MLSLIAHFSDKVAGAQSEVLMARFFTCSGIVLVFIPRFSNSGALLIDSEWLKSWAQRKTRVRNLAMLNSGSWVTQFWKRVSIIYINGWFWQLSEITCMPDATQFEES